MYNFTLRKRLLALAICVFTCIGMCAQVSGGVNGNTLLLTPENVTTESWNLPSDVTTVKLVGTFNGWSSGWLKNGGSESKSDITTIDLSEAIMTSTTAGEPDTNGDVRSNNANWQFGNFKNTSLQIKWPVAGNITVIPDNAFSLTGLQSVTIPGYIETICSHAFDSADGDGYLHTIFFDEYDSNNDGTSNVNMFIGYQAFSNTTAVVDVYVMTLGTLVASNMAFPEKITYGQGNTSSNLARLHFPEEKASEYVNQSHTLDQATAADEGKFQKWLVDHYNAAQSNDNGFHEFVSSGSNPPAEDKDWGEVVLRTFSHPTIDYVVPKGAKAYIVNNVSKNGSTYILKLRKVNVIPHGTGVILYGGTNYSNTITENGVTTTKRTIEMMAVKFDGDPYTINTTGDYRNLLVSTSSVDTSGKPTMIGVEVSPYEMEGDNVIFRNFFMGKFRSTKSGKQYIKNHPDYNGNFVGFFRAIQSTIGSRKAYLRVPANEFNAPQGGEIIVPADVSDVTVGGNTVRSYRVEYTKGSTEGNESIYTEDEMKAAGYWYKSENQPIEWTDDWGVRNLDSSFTMAKYEGEPFIETIDEEGVATMIYPTSTVEKDSNYYTLQGSKVNNPSKGVYIKNGKIVVVK